MPKKSLTIQDFNQKFSGSLYIELTKPTQLISPNLLNEFAPADAQIKSLRFEPEVENEANLPDGDDYFRAPTKAELEAVYYPHPALKLRSMGEVVEHMVSNGVGFTARDLIAAIEETERQTRGQSNWFGGVDCHHVYFEGLRVDENGVWRICWGS